MSKQQNIEIKFQDGSISMIDQDVHRLLVEMQQKVRNSQILPRFYNFTRAMGQHEEKLLDFYSFLISKRSLSKSQLFQDLFVLFYLKEKKNGTFLDFGATDGIENSNSFMLENHFGWTGVLAEPSQQWHKNLINNRPKAKIIKDAIYSETGKELDFFVSDAGELSTLEEFRNADATSMPGNAKARNRNGYVNKVRSISLNDVFLKFFNGLPIDYMSVDSEGSELKILENFDFKRFGPSVITVEHNSSEYDASNEKMLDALFQNNNYKRVFKEQTQFDAWYVIQK